MSLLDEARAETRLKGPGCRVGQYLAVYDDLPEALAAVKEGALEGVALERALRKRDNGDMAPLKSDTIRRHVAGECSCPS